MLASVRTLPVKDVTQSHIDTLHATLTELDHAAPAAKSPWERRKSLGNRVAEGKALVATATVERDAAKLRREAAVRAHADSEQALRDAEHSLAGVIDDWGKVQSEVQAEAAEEGGNDMEVERTLASNRHRVLELGGSGASAAAVRRVHLGRQGRARCQPPAYASRDVHSRTLTRSPTPAPHIWHP